MQINSYNSQKIKVLNLILILMVVYIHSYYLEAESNHPLALGIQLMCSGYGLSCVANSLFFFFSGLLFFNGIESVKDCFPKIKKRIRSLLVPYIIWNVIFVIWYMVLQNLPYIGVLIKDDMLCRVFQPNIFASLYELFWIPANFPLWFLRDLMIMVAVSPLLYFVIKYIKWFAPLLFVLVSPFVALHISPFFLLGGCVAMHSSLEEISEKLIGGEKTFVAAAIYLGYSVVQIWMKEHHPYVSFVVCLCGIITIWELYDWIESKLLLKSKLSSLKFALGYSFFIYLFHEPAFNIIKKLGLKVLGVHEWSLILLYLINPLIMCAIAIMVAKLLQRFTPKMYSILVGGR